VPYAAKYENSDGEQAFTLLERIKQGFRLFEKERVESISDRNSHNFALCSRATPSAC
jgi:hypothetical protein